MKKIILTSFLSCISVLIFAQVPTIKIINDVDFWNGEEAIDSLSADFETTGNVLYKRFFSNTKIVWQEYLKISKDSFLFVQYDKNTHEVLQEGKVVPMLCCSRNDTALSYDPETYEEQNLVRRKMKFGKEDEWLEIKDSIVERGRYKNNKRIGEWMSRNISLSDFRQYTYYDRSGAVVNNQPFNILETKDSSQIAYRLCACWRIDENTGGLIKLETCSKGVSQYAYSNVTWEFSEMEIRHIRSNNGDIRYRSLYSTGKWALNGDILTITGDVPIRKKYKILYLGQGKLHLQEIE